MPFRVIVDCPFKSVCRIDNPSHIDKEWVLSIVNDYEDGKWRHDIFEQFIWDNLKI